MNRRDFLKLGAASGVGLALGVRPEIEEEPTHLERPDALLEDFPPVRWVYYVDDCDGDDRNNGLSARTAWKTLRRANAGVQAGDLVYCTRQRRAYSYARLLKRTDVTDQEIHEIWKSTGIGYWGES